MNEIRRCRLLLFRGPSLHIVRSCFPKKLPNLLSTADADFDFNFPTSAESMYFNNEVLAFSGECS